VTGVAAIGVFCLGFRDLALLSVSVALARFFVNGHGRDVPLLATLSRGAAGGTGFVIGVGRGGLAVGLVIAGALFAGG
jgi:hypothetical protein